jgi:thioredoxin-related protein
LYFYHANYWILLKFLSFFFLSFSFFYWCQEQTTNQLNYGDLAPKTELILKNTKGFETNLQGFKKKNGLLVVFSCNSCPFVVGTPGFPGWELSYNMIFKEAEKHKIGMVLINSIEGKRGNEDSFLNMQKRSDSMSYLMPYLLDKNSVLADAFGAKTTPHIFLFDEKLHLVYSGCIDNLADNKRTKVKSYLINAMIAISNKKKPKPSKTSPVGCSIKRTKAKK